MAIARKLLAVILCMALFGCSAGTSDKLEAVGNSSEEASNDSLKSSDEEVEIIEEAEELLIWSYTDEILNEIKAFEEVYNADVTVEVMDMNGLIPMAAGVIKSGINMPDVIILEESQLSNPQLTTLLYDLSTLEGEDYTIDSIADYSLNKARDLDGKLLGISYQVAPVGIFYRRSMARQAFGTDDPAVISEMFSSYEKLSNGMDKLSESDLKLFADIFTLRKFSNLDEAWINEAGLFNEDNKIREFLELIKKAQYNKQVAFATEWSDEWIQGMYKSISNSYGEDMNVFAYLLPSWGLSNILMLASDETEALLTNEDQSIKVFNRTSGDWALARPKNPISSGSSYLTINKTSEHIELSEQFLTFMLFNKEHLESWLTESDIISSVNTFQNEQSFYEGDVFLGGQSYHEEFSSIAKYIKINIYEDKLLEDKNIMIQTYFDEMVIEFIQGEFHTIDEAIKVFRTQVEEMYPELFVVPTPE